MPFNVLKSLAGRYSGAIGLEQLMPHSARAKVSAALGLLVTFLFIPLVLNLLAWVFPPFAAVVTSVPGVDFLLPKLVGLFCVTFSLWLLFFAAESYYYSFYFGALDAILSEKGIGNKEPISFGVALLASTSDENDITASFVRSDEGELILFRTGLIRDDIDNFLKMRTGRLTV